MSKQDYIRALNRALRRIRADEREKFLSYYAELIDDMTDGGMDEWEAVAALEPVEVVAGPILEDAAAQGLLKAKRNPMTIALLVIGSPLWLSIMLVFLALLLVVVVLVWALAVCFCAVEVTFALGGLFGLFMMFYCFSDGLISIIGFLGGGLILTGLALLLFFPLMKLLKLMAVETVKCGKGIINYFTKKAGLD